jgi:hypothetical protein
VRGAARAGSLALALAAGACGGRDAPVGATAGAGGSAPGASASAAPERSAPAAELAAPLLEPGINPSALLASPVGGPWLHCYDNFRPESGPRRDLTRLAMLCGHVNGMRAIGPVEEGDLVEGGDVRAHPFALKAGECVRLFAVAEAAVDDLSLALAGPTGQLGHATPETTWAVTLADRPLCVAAAGDYVMQVRSRKGSGRYAAQAWRLP